jgi:hypothetical protein
MNVFRIMWAILLILAGMYVFYRINDTSDPSSFKSIVEEYREVVDEYPEIP